MRDGDIITLDYEGHTDGELFDTTLEKAAKDADAHEEGRPYGPITVIIGEGRLVPVRARAPLRWDWCISTPRRG